MWKNCNSIYLELPYGQVPVQAHRYPYGAQVTIQVHRYPYKHTGTHTDAGALLFPLPENPLMGVPEQTGTVNGLQL